jgi:hypothetical protein
MLSWHYRIASMWVSTQNHLIHGTPRGLEA